MSLHTPGDVRSAWSVAARAEDPSPCRLATLLQRLSPDLATSSRIRDYSGSPPVKRGHTPQISISDDTHHVTEAIGYMYGDEQYDSSHAARPLSFMKSPLSDSFDQPQQSSTSPTSPAQSFSARVNLNRTMSKERERTTPQANGAGYMVPGRSNSFGLDTGPLSPPVSGVRSPTETANSSFPLNDLTYESDPAAVAQELSNLQALRRMSMDVNGTGDPDLPSFGSSLGIPTVAPTDSAEEDPSRLFWVPARLHPELAPKEFKTFLDNRVDSIKRRSGDMTFAADGLERQESNGGLRRKKSMLSRQIDNSGGRGADGYQDGAERLGRKKSRGAQESLTPMSKLTELEELVSDPANAIRKLSLDAEHVAVGGEVPASEDMPILPAAPPGNLQRSTRTTYRRGSARKGERIGSSRRLHKTTETDTEESPISPPMVSPSEIYEQPKAQTESLPVVHEKQLENFSRPTRLNRSRGSQSTASGIPTSPPNNNFTANNQSSQSTQPPIGTVVTPLTLSITPTSATPRHFVSQIASNGRSTFQPQLLEKQIPQIVQTLPSQERVPTRASIERQSELPDRVSSNETKQETMPQARITSPTSNGPPSTRGGRRPSVVRQDQSETVNKTLRDMAAHPSPLPGNSTRTDSLSFIPTLTEDKKVDAPKKVITKKGSDDGTRKTSWSWSSLLGSEEKEKEKRKEEEAKEVRLRKTRAAKLGEKAHDSTRLDVLQTTMEGPRGRESLVLSREDLKLEEERKKESTRKSSVADLKKEKDGIFSSLFGGGKKKADHEKTTKKIDRALSPAPLPRVLKPDVDYNWTRFSILEERAIYRMAHIKLANPRRALCSQVLLSNFMYSYLAKVQQMHPQIQIPQTAAQKVQQRQQQQAQQQQQQRKADQPEEFYQYQKYQEQQQLQQQQEQEQAASRRGSSVSQSYQSSSYIDDSDNFEYGGQDEGDMEGGYRPQSRASQHSNRSMEGAGHHGRGYYGGDHGGSSSPASSAYSFQHPQFDDPGDQEAW
ncbi:MAG: hypothetical protein MMC33_001054 [Icmadophila ericetorum]|nr:hypothetical protein [Icmadophila ericetorum]